jgi:hypothetical protein
MSLLLPSLIYASHPSVGEYKYECCCLLEDWIAKSIRWLGYVLDSRGIVVRFLADTIDFYLLQNCKTGGRAYPKLPDQRWGSPKTARPAVGLTQNCQTGGGAHPKLPDRQWGSPKTSRPAVGLTQNCQTSGGAHPRLPDRRWGSPKPLFFGWGTDSSFPDVKQPRREVIHLPTSSAESKNEWNTGMRHITTFGQRRTADTTVKT